MPAFRYEALDATGRTVSGTLQADTPRQTRSLLRAQGLLPSRIDRVGGQDGVRRPWSRGISAANLSLVTRQLATLLESGLTVEQALTALIAEVESPAVQDILSGVKAELLAGLPLAGALATYEDSFPDFYRALVHGGEQSGALPTVLQHLADYLDAREALKHKTGIALLYPVLVMTVAVAIVTGLLMYVVPQVVQVFEQSRQALPLMTRALIALSDFLRGAWPYLAVLAVAGWAAARMVLRGADARRRWHALQLGLPWLGGVIRSVNASRFAGTLAILVNGGVPLLTALESATRVMGNLAMRAAVEGAIARVREGESLARALGASKAFPPLLVHLVASGEVSGRLDAMLQRAAALEAQSLERRLAVFLMLLEPVMVLVMGGIVLLIVLAILLPVIEINQLVR